MPPIRLDRANMAELMGNSWPKWAPIQGAGRVWLAFTSLRPYGRVVPNDPLDQGTEPRPQIWVTGIDPLAEDGDPSAPAFWMPGQNTAIFFRICSSTIPAFSTWAATRRCWTSWRS